MAINALAEEKRLGHDFATVIRGGVEPHGMEVLANARHQGLVVHDLRPPLDLNDALEAFASAPRADVYNVTSFMSDELISLFYSGADAVFANSGHEPFGLVGLEVMAAGGLAFVGSTGEDYAVPYLNAVVLDTDDPSEINISLDVLRKHPEVVTRMRKDGQETARSFSWQNVIADTLLGKLEYVCQRQLVEVPTSSRGAGLIKDQADAQAAIDEDIKTSMDPVGTQDEPCATPSTGGSAPSGSAASPAEPGPASESGSPPPAYGGAATNCRLMVRPQNTEEPIRHKSQRNRKA
jgi:hypothetical protein